MELLTKEKTVTECETCGTISIEQDLWRQLKRVRMPVFYGDKRLYQSWKAAFLACIDAAPATAEYKLLQLRQYVAGKHLIQLMVWDIQHRHTKWQKKGWKESLEVRVDKF